MSKIGEEGNRRDLTSLEWPSWQIFGALVPLLVLWKPLKESEESQLDLWAYTIGKNSHRSGY